MEKGIILRQVIYLVQAQNPIQARARLFVHLRIQPRFCQRSAP